MKVPAFAVAALLTLSLAVLAPPRLVEASDAPSPEHDDSPCRGRVPDYVALRDLMAQPTTYVGRCIRTHGLVVSRYVYPDLEGLYFNSDQNVGLYTYDESLGDDLFSYRAWTEITGVVDTCERIHAAASAEEARLQAENELDFVFVGGPCHYYTHLAVLDVFAFARVDGRPLRLTAAGLPPNLWLLRQADALRPDEVHLSEAIERWFAAVKAQDAARIDELHSGKARPLSASELQYYARMTDPRSPVADLIAREGPLRVVFFRFVHGVLRTASWEEVESRLFGCVCKTDDCEGLWPIAPEDTYADIRWPYVCAAALSSATGVIVERDLFWYLASIPDDVE